MNKLMGLLLLGFGLCFVVSNAEAATGVRGAKGSVTTVNNTNVVAVSSNTAVLYAVMLSTGTQTTDYVVFYDSASASGLSSTLQTASSGYKGRIYVSSSAVNTLVTFDPPWQFKNGIMAVNSAAGISSTIVYETGHVTNGY